jgi:HEPN domain-containing protein
MKSHAAEAKRLLRIARRDLKSFTLLKSGGEEYAVDAKFHAQQSVEKCLKAVLVFNDLKARRIHSLLDLALELKMAGVELPFDPNDLDKLTAYAVTLRYDDEEVLLLDYAEATKLVEGVFEWAKEKVNE